jgi:c-di-GMP-binding flagellar brake protein YcgR
MVLTSLISYNDNGIFLDLGASEEMNRKAVETKKLFCVTQLDKVKIQFILRAVRTVETTSGPAFFAPLPESVLRLQRREYYRLAMPIARPLKCVLTFPATEGEARVLEANVGDISGGGLCLVSIPLGEPIETGLELDCKLDLPEVGLVKSRIVVRSAFETATRSGHKSRRAGCEFIKLPGPMLTLIQRFIIKIERERKARDSGMN